MPGVCYTKGMTKGGLVMAQSKIKLMPNMAKQKPHAKPKMSKLHKRRLWVLTALLAVILAVGGWQLYAVHSQLTTATATVHQAQHTLKQVKAQKHALNVQVDQLHNDDYLAKLVRQKYMVSKSGEVIFQLPGTAGKLLTPAPGK